MNNPPAISSVVIPSSEEDRLAIRRVMKEISDSMTRMDGEKDFIKDAIGDLSKQYSTISDNTILFFIISYPFIIIPNTTYLLSKWQQPPCFVNIKNCELFLSLPQLAIETNPSWLCFRLKFSSGKYLPYAEYPLVPLLLITSPP